MFTRLDYSSALEYSIIRRYTNIVYYYYKSNAYIDPSMNIISPSTQVFDLGISMSSNCTFDLHISNLNRRCSNRAGWILRTFTMRDPHLMLTLFKSLVLSRLDYASQLWSPYLLKHIYLLEKVQRAFTKHFTGIHDLSYSKRCMASCMANLSKCHVVFSSSTFIRPDKDAFEGHLCQTVNNFVKQNKSSLLSPVRKRHRFHGSKPL